MESVAKDRSGPVATLSSSFRCQRRQRLRRIRKRLCRLEVVPQKQGRSWGFGIYGLLFLKWRRSLAKLSYHLLRWGKQGGQRVDCHGLWRGRREGSSLSLWQRFVACRNSTDCHNLNIDAYQVLKPTKTCVAVWIKTLPQPTNLDDGRPRPRRRNDDDHDGRRLTDNQV